MMSKGLPGQWHVSGLQVHPFLLPTAMNKLNEISSQFTNLETRVFRDSEGENRQRDEQELKNLLVATCSVVDQAGNDTAIEKAADILLNKMVSLAYSETFEIDFLENFTPNAILQDPASEGLAGMGESLISIAQGNEF